MSRGDAIARFMSSAGTFRVLTVQADAAVAEALRVAGEAGAAARGFAELLMGAALYQRAMAPVDRIQVSVVGPGLGGRLTAEAWPIEGGVGVRGTIQAAGGDRGAMGAPTGAARMQVTRVGVRRGEPWESTLDVPDGSIADAFQLLSLQSDQTITFVAFDVAGLDGGHPRAAGLLGQAMPDLSREDLAEVTRCLEARSFSAAAAALDHDAAAAARAVFADLAPVDLGTDAVAFRCRCSRDAARDALAIAGDEALAALRAGGTETVSCDFCGAVYEFTGADLGGDGGGNDGGGAPTVH